MREAQLRLEAAGTARIERAVFSEREQEEALAADTAAVAGLTHSQRQLPGPHSPPIAGSIHFPWIAR